MFIYDVDRYIFFHVMSVVCVIEGVPRMEPRVPFALFPFGLCPIKFS